MQDLINMSLAEIRRDEYRMQTAKIEAHQWKHGTAPLPALRTTIAKALIALASRLAPALPEQPERQTPATATR